MDSSPSTIDVLPDIVKAVGDKLDIIVDSGVRRGSDMSLSPSLSERTPA